MAKLNKLEEQMRDLGIAHYRKAARSCSDDLDQYGVAILVNNTSEISELQRRRIRVIRRESDGELYLTEYGGWNGDLTPRRCRHALAILRQQIGQSADPLYAGLDETFVQNLATGGYSSIAYLRAKRNKNVKAQTYWAAELGIAAARHLDTEYDSVSKKGMSEYAIRCVRRAARQQVI